MRSISNESDKTPADEPPLIVAEDADREELVLSLDAIESRNGPLSQGLHALREAARTPLT